MSQCRDSISALVGACLSSRRDFIRFALAGSSLPFMRSQGLGSSLANDRTRWYRDAKFGMFIHWEPYSLANVEASWPIMTPTPAGISEAEYRELLRPQDSNIWCSRLNITMAFACSTLPTQTTRSRILLTERMSLGNWRTLVVKGTCYLGFTTHRPICTTRLFVTPRNWRKKIGTGACPA